MLRIDVTRTESAEPCLQLAGRLVGAWVAELELVATKLLGKRQSPQLDLSQVHFVDQSGLALLRDLQGRGAVVVAASPFVGELLRESPGQ